MKHFIFLFSAILFGLTFTHAVSQPSLNAEAQKQMVLSNLSAMPLAFTQNRGQWDEKALFRAEAGGATFWFCKDEVAYQFTRNTDELIEDGLPNEPTMPGIPDKFNHPRYKKESMALYAQFVGANLDAEVIGENRLGYNCNYFLGNIPSKWATDVANYSSLVYKDLYPGIDLVYHGNGTGMKNDFIINPGANISSIKIKYDGADNLSITNQGELESATSFGPVHENIPEIYQEINGNKERREGRYILRENGIYGFEVDDYNPNYPITIDPELIYSTYLGGSDNDAGYGIAVDASGNAYVTGETFSPDFPTQNPYQPYQGHSFYTDAFIAKFSPSGDSLIYSTYLGGALFDIGSGIAVDAMGNAYIVGSTGSYDFPTQNPYQGFQGPTGYQDAFITKLSPSGNSLIYSTYLGAQNSDDYGSGIAIDASGNAYVTGKTYSYNFPTQNPYQNIYQGYGDAFVAKLSASGNSLVFSTYLGGNGDDNSYAIAVDASGNAYVAGWTSSSDFPIQNPYQNILKGNWDAFITKFSISGNSLVYSTYLGGNDDDWANGIAADASGNAYVAGTTDSDNFPTINPYQTYQGGYDVFIAKLSPYDNSLIYSTCLGGNNDDESSAISVDASGNAFVIGYTESGDFPIYNPYQTYLHDMDAFITKLSASGQSLIYSTYLGGNSTDNGWGIAVDTSGNAYMTGITYSTDFPTQNPYETDPDQGWQDAFVAKFGSQGICTYLPGDINGNGSVNGVDIVYGVNYLKGGIAPPIDCHPNCLSTPAPFYAAGDVNGNCAFNGIDITFFVRYLKGQVPSLLYCSDCPPGR